METRNRGIYRKVRLLRLWVIFVIMKVMKSYNTLNDYYRKLLEKRLLKSLLMRDLTVPIVMELWLMEAVLFVRFQVLEMLL